MCIRRRLFAYRILTLAGWGLAVLAADAHGQEPIPRLPSAAAAEQQEGAAVPCLDLTDPPLTSLSADIRPRTAEGELVEPSELPVNCWAAVGRGGPPIFIAIGPAYPWWDARYVLQLARFCHQPLYFEDTPLERSGVHGRLPQVCSVQQFLCDLAWLPARLIVRPPGSCVPTPLPYICNPYR